MPFKPTGTPWQEYSALKSRLLSGASIDSCHLDRAWPDVCRADDDLDDTEAAGFTRWAPTEELHLLLLLHRAAATVGPPASGNYWFSPLRPPETQTP